MLEIRSTIGGRNTRDYQFGGCCFASAPHPLLWRSLSLSEANIHFRSAISNVTGPLLEQGYGTKVCPPFMSSTLSPGLLMNITHWFTEKLKMLSAGFRFSPVVFSGGRRSSKKVFSFTGLSLFGVSVLVSLM